MGATARRVSRRFGVEAECRYPQVQAPAKSGSTRFPACFGEASRRVQRGPSGEKWRKMLCVAGGIRTRSPVGYIAIGLEHARIRIVRERPRQSSAVLCGCEKILGA
jgi:hypothetical protein